MQKIACVLKPLLLLLLLWQAPKAYATHIVGGEMNYEYIGNDTYIIRLTVYRDCSPGVTTPYDDPAFVGVFNSAGALVLDLQLFFQGSQPLNTQFNFDCGVEPTGVCVETTTYTQTITLPPTPGGYTISYQRCCRNNTITNVVNPGSVGATYSATIPDISLGLNSNPVFDNPPPVYACANAPLQLDFSATDLDGDSLVYNLCVPVDGALSNDPQPTPIGFYPTTPITWQTPYSQTNVLGGTPAATINSQTGIFTANPNTLGQFVVGICVDEYRNGQYISTTSRDIQINVVDCQLAIVSAFQIPTNGCSNTVTFNNTSVGGTSYSWNFGDTTTTTDVSTLQNPTYTYPNVGTYTVTLIASNPQFPDCDDTLITNITILPPFNLPPSPDVVTCTGAAVVLGPTGIINASFLWTPSFGLNNDVLQNPEVFNPTVSTTYIVSATDSAGCVVTDTVELTVVDNLVPVVDTTLTADCNGIILTLALSDSLSFVDSLQWTINDSLLFSTNQVNINVGGLDTVTYTLNTALGGCLGSTSGTLVFTGLNLFQLPIPNVFTPNTDNFNDCFKPNILQGFETCYTMEIYNRWGTKVFETTDGATCWNGKLNNTGADCSEGVYFYILKVADATYNGSVTLVTNKS